jgi:uncharacterized CHY-type Zn-finger protein
MKLLVKKPVKFTCFDCKKEIEGHPTPVLRHSEDGDLTSRQVVCLRCLLGNIPIKKGKHA